MTKFRGIFVVIILVALAFLCFMFLRKPGFFPVVSKIIPQKKSLNIPEQDIAAAEKLYDEAVLAGNNQDYPRAIELFQKTLELNPNKTYAYFCLGYIYEANGNLKGAISSYEKYISSDDKNPEVFYNLGNCYLKLQIWDKAVDDYLKVVSLNPKHLDAWVNLSIASSQKGDYKKALEYCDKAVALGYQPPEGYLENLKAKM